MSDSPENLTQRQRDGEIAKILADAVIRMRATPMNHFGKKWSNSLDYELEQSVYAPNK